MTALGQTARISGRHLHAFARQPWFVVMSVVQPAIWLLLFGALFSNVTRIPGFESRSYLDYLVPGVVVMTALFWCGWSGMSLIEDLDRAIIDRYLTTPVHRSAIVGGLSLYQLVTLALQVAIIGLMATALGARSAGGIAGFGLLVLCTLLLGAAVSSFSNAMALILRQRESVIGINTMMTLPLTFLSAAFLPLALAPDWIQVLARFNPVDWAVEAGRDAMSGAPDPGLIAPRMIGLLLLALLSTAWATWTFRSYLKSL